MIVSKNTTELYESQEVIEDKKKKKQFVDKLA
jgi:hypothetical protein